VALFAGPAGAADSPLHRISLDSAIAAALRNNRTLKAGGLRGEAASAEVRAARGAMIPRLDANENVSYSNNPVQVFSDRLLQQDFSERNFGLNALNYPNYLSNFQSQIVLSYPLFAGGRLIAAYRAAGFAADVEHWRSIQARQAVEFDVIEAYYAAMLAEQKMDVVDRGLAAARAHLTQAGDLFRHGMVVNSDVLRTRVLVGNLEQERLDTQSQVEITRAKLAHILAAEDEAVAPIKAPSVLSHPAQAPGELKVLQDQAVAARPEIKVADSRVRQAREAVTIARADYLPTVGLSGIYENDSERLVRAGNNAGVLLTGHFNLFNGMATRAKVDAAEADLSRAQVLADDLRHAIRLGVETAYRNLLAARQQLEVAKGDVTYADRALKILEDRYGSGLATNVAVLDAQATRDEADLRAVTVEVTVAVDNAALELATGHEPGSAAGS
jgi:outer membrane protein TolC